MFVAFVDECKAKRFTLAVTLVLPRDIPAVRRSLVELRKPGQTRIHFAKESDRRRRQILSKIFLLPQSTRFYFSDSKHDGQARDECLRALLRQCRQLKVHRLVIERDHSLERQDRQTIREEIYCGAQEVEYLHESPALEPCLWIPDAMAWVRNRGGDWITR